MSRVSPCLVFVTQCYIASCPAQVVLSVSVPPLSIYQIDRYRPDGLSFWNVWCESAFFVCPILRILLYARAMRSVYMSSVVIYWNGCYPVLGFFGCENTSICSLVRLNGCFLYRLVLCQW